MKNVLGGLYMDLRDTVDLMLSTNFKDRFRAEYYQVKYRYEKLMDTINDIKSGEADFTPLCPIDLYEIQSDAMYNYMKVLESRAQFEKIEL